MDNQGMVEQMTYPDDILKAAENVTTLFRPVLTFREAERLNDEIAERLMAERETLLRRAESLIAAGKGLPFKPSFGMLVIEWMRQIQREGK